MTVPGQKKKLQEIGAAAVSVCEKLDGHCWIEILSEILDFSVGDSIFLLVHLWLFDISDCVGMSN